MTKNKRTEKSQFTENTMNPVYDELKVKRKWKMSVV